MKNVHVNTLKWYKGEKDLAPCPNNPNTQLYVMYRALYECSKSHSGTAKDVVFMLACIEATGEMPTGIRPIKVNKEGSSRADISRRLRDLLYRGYVRQITPVGWDSNMFSNSYANQALLEKVVWRIATRQEYKEVSAIYEAQRLRQDSRRPTKKRKIYASSAAPKAFTEHVAETFPLQHDSREALKAQAIAEVKAEMKESQIRILKHALSFGAGAAITFILTLLGRML